jgi:Ni/Fe-hydrogenase subunit HybB-like protein
MDENEFFRMAALDICENLQIEQGMGLVTGGFIPTSLHEAMDYLPTALELLISLGIYAIGAFILTVLFKIVVGVKREAIHAK